MQNNNFLTVREEQLCDWCLRIGGIYNRRGNLIKEGMIELGMKLDPSIKGFIRDFLGWVLKQDELTVNEKDVWQE